MLAPWIALRLNLSSRESKARQGARLPRHRTGPGVKTQATTHHHHQRNLLNTLHVSQPCHPCWRNPPFRFLFLVLLRRSYTVTSLSAQYHQPSLSRLDRAAPPLTQSYDDCPHLVSLRYENRVQSTRHLRANIVRQTSNLERLLLILALGLFEGVVSALRVLALAVALAVARSHLPPLHQYSLPPNCWT